LSIRWHLRSTANQLFLATLRPLLLKTITVLLEDGMALEENM
jgi:hypothetical protein